MNLGLMKNGPNFGRNKNMIAIEFNITKSFTDLITTEELRLESRKILISYANKVKNRAQKPDRVPRRTRTLLKSIKAKGTPNSNDLIEIVAEARYAGFVEPEPLGVKMRRNMRRTPYLWVSAVELFPSCQTSMARMIRAKLFKKL